MIRATLIPSPLKRHKWRMIFTRKPDFEEAVDFGAKGYYDYTQHHDDKRKQLFLSRFKKMIDRYKDDPSAPMTLSHQILWTEKDLGVALKNYKKKYNLL